jgi:putative DNA primase/helicase
MKHDGQLHIAIGRSAESKVWKNTTLLYSDLAQRLATEYKTTETHREFLQATKAEQGKIKDVGGYVGAYLRNGKRSPQNVVHRQLLTLDIDFAHKEFWEDFTLSYHQAAILHGTHKHCDADPRYRLVMPLSREATPDEYVAVARYIAGDMGIDLFDNTTFETNRLMFWPSSPKDIPYYFEQQDGPWVDVDEILGRYIDWTDTSLWPVADKKLRAIGEAAQKQENPEAKRGIVGAFCRTHGITSAVETFLTDAYVPAGDGRYTYTKGSTAAGLVLYDDKFAYSHHGTDPAADGHVHNAFDLVRIHRFGHLDGEETQRNPTKLKSYQAMQDLARKDPEVKKTIAAESLANAKYEFAQPDEDETAEVPGDTETLDEATIEWMTKLETDARNKYCSTAANISLIFANDVRLRQMFRYNLFDNKRYVFATLPWRRIDKPEPIKNVDYSGIRNYIECVYDITGTQKIDDALALEFDKNAYHPIKDYLDELTWDGVPRIDTLLVDYFGASDSLYTRESIRKPLVGAVARIRKPGTKYDTMQITIGPQGCGKSTFLKKLGKDWYSDSFTTVQGKEAFEQLQGAWIVEVPEMAGMRKADRETIKHFMSKQEDTFRPAYARSPETFLRSSILFGTANIKELFNDPSGNRRFHPADAEVSRIRKSVFDDLDGEVDQIWAEAVHLYENGETLILSTEAEVIAKSKQIEHSELDERRGVIEQYLDKPLPKNWNELDIFPRRMYLEEPTATGGVLRDVVCIAELWCECLGKNKEDMDRYKTRDINDIMKSLPDWEAVNSTKNFPIYGKQKYYIRKID